MESKIFILMYLVTESADILYAYVVHIYLLYTLQRNISMLYVLLKHLKPGICKILLILYISANNFTLFPKQTMNS